MRAPWKIWLTVLWLLTACHPESAKSPQVPESRSGIANAAINEASGLESSLSRPDTWFVHNDDGPPVLFVISSDGRDLGRVEVEGARNRDWEDITGFRLDGHDFLAIADTGDNSAQRDHVTLYFLAEPQPDAHGRYRGMVPLLHQIDLQYPDGPRDCESVTVDPASQRILFLTKRDLPPRLYAIDLETAMASTRAELEFLGESVPFRNPTAEDLRVFGPREWRWVSQPTGLDINPAGDQAAVISYRSVYLFERAANESWAQALAQSPVEFLGPPAKQEESIAFSLDGDFLLITTEGQPAPLFRLSPNDHPAGDP